MDSQKQLNSVDFAINAVGGIRPLARLLNISAPSVWEWRQRGQIPAGRVLQIEKLTGISRHVLRGDLYPIEYARKRA